MIAVARASSLSIRSTRVSPRIHRLGRSRVGSRYANAVFQRTEPTLFLGIRAVPGPHSGPLRPVRMERPTLLDGLQEGDIELGELFGYGLPSAELSLRQLEIHRVLVEPHPWLPSPTQQAWSPGGARCDPRASRRPSRRSSGHRPFSYGP
jgi:hypothetical protein